MKQNIRARDIVERETAYKQAKAKALALLDSPFHLGGGAVPAREKLHDRKILR